MVVLKVAGAAWGNFMWRFIFAALLTGIASAAQADTVTLPDNGIFTLVGTTSTEDVRFSISAVFHAPGYYCFGSGYCQYDERVTAEIGYNSGLLIGSPASNPFGQQMCYQCDAGTVYPTATFSLLDGSTTFSISSGSLPNDPPISYTITADLPDGVTLTPLPPTLPLFGSALAALGFLRTRRNAKRDGISVPV